MRTDRLSLKILALLLSLLTLLSLASCGRTPDSTAKIAAEPTAENTPPETTAAETEHVHAFTEKVQNDKYLKQAASCGDRPIYYLSCVCGEHGTGTFRGDPVPHAFGVSVTDAGVIERAFCTNEGCDHVETLNLALPTVGTLTGALNCSDAGYRETDSAKIFYYSNCQSTDYTTALRSLQSAGCTQEGSYRLGDNRYSLLKNDKFTAYLSYLADEGAIRLYVGRSDDLVPPRVSGGTGAGTVEPALWQINVDCRAAKANGGMSYVLQLPDGKFIVIDGGYETDADADAIYRILSENKPEAHEKPIIAAWFITHMHIDHCGTLRRFTSLHKSDVEVEGFYYNFPYINVGDIWPSNNRNWEDLMASWEGAALYRKLHSGMQFSFAGAKITVLCTFEDVYPLSFNSGNDTSAVFKVEIAGQSILFLGDAEYGESDVMMHLSADVLHADILQYAHHGYDKQCRGELYRKIDPETVLWPMPFVNWESDSYGKVFQPRYEGTLTNKHRENEWIRGADSVKKIIVMAEGTTKLDLPYTPTGARNADYDALYRQQLP